jgi:hypothetical protein
MDNAQLQDQLDTLSGVTISSVELADDENSFLVKLENSTAFSIGTDEEGSLCFTVYHTRPKEMH